MVGSTNRQHIMSTPRTAWPTGPKMEGTSLCLLDHSLHQILSRVRSDQFAVFPFYAIPKLETFNVIFTWYYNGQNAVGDFTILFSQQHLYVIPMTAAKLSLWWVFLCKWHIQFTDFFLCKPKTKSTYWFLVSINRPHSQVIRRQEL